MPPVTLSNADLERLVDTDDEWIVQRTGIRNRRLSHVEATDLAELAARRALACAGMEASDLDLIVVRPRDQVSGASGSRFHRQS